MASKYTYAQPLADLFKEEEPIAVPESTGIVSRPGPQQDAPDKAQYDPLGYLPDFGATVRSFFTKEEADELDATPRASDVRRSAIDEVLTGMDLLSFESAMEARAAREKRGIPSPSGATMSSERPQSRTGLLASGPAMSSVSPQSRPEPEAPEIDTTAIEALVKRVVGGSADTEDTAPVTTEANTGGAGLMSPAMEEQGLMPSLRTKSKGLTEDDMGLLDFIGTGEGGYDSANRGTIRGNVIGSQKVASRGGKKVSELTVAEIKKYQSITDPNNKDRLFTVGKYQAIPDTFNQAVKGLGLPDDTVFTPEVQEKVGLYLVSEKRPKVGKFLRGEGDVTTDTAMLELAKEFASIPVPFDIAKGKYGKWPKTDLVAGDSFYKDPKASKGNKAGHTVAETRAVLEAAKR